MKKEVWFSLLCTVILAGPSSNNHAVEASIYYARHLAKSIYYVEFSTFFFSLMPFLLNSTCINFYGVFLFSLFIFTFDQIFKTMIFREHYMGLYPMGHRREKEAIIRSIWIGFLMIPLLPATIIAALYLLITKQDVDLDDIVGEDSKVLFYLTD